MMMSATSTSPAGAPFVRAEAPFRSVFVEDLTGAFLATVTPSLRVMLRGPLAIALLRLCAHSWQVARALAKRVCGGSIATCPNLVKSDSPKRGFVVISKNRRNDGGRPRAAALAGAGRRERRACDRRRDTVLGSAAGRLEARGFGER